MGECGIKGTFTLATALVPSLAETPITPLTFSFTDGVHTWTRSTVQTFAIGTDSSGAINAWDIGAISPAKCTMGRCVTLESENDSNVTQNGDYSTLSSISSSRDILIGHFPAVLTPGTWAVSGPPATPLTLDKFESGRHMVSLVTASSQDTHYGALASGSPLGVARYTLFSLLANLYGQKSTLDVANGTCTVDAGFGGSPALLIGYGYTLTGSPAPLALNLGAYTGLQLNFAGDASSQDLLVIITVTTNSAGVWDLGMVLPPEGNPFTVTFPFSSFGTSGGGGGLTQSDVSDITAISILAEGGGFASFGITSFQAYE